MLLPIRHATKCSSGNSSSSSSSLLQQRPHTRQALSSYAQNLHIRISPSFRLTCKVSSRPAAGAQQDLLQQRNDVVQSQQQAHQEAATHQDPGCLDSSPPSAVVEVAEAGVAAAAAAPHAHVLGSAACGCIPDHQSSSNTRASADADVAAAAEVHADADAAATAAPDTSGSDSEQQQQQEEQPKVEFMSYYQQIDEHPVPVQLPPPGCTNEPPLQRPFFNRARYKSPAFLRHFPAAPKHAPFNFLSFLGPVEWHGGKYQVPPAVLDDFLLPYFQTAFHAKRRLHIAQSYQGQPYKYFQELDFPWTLDIDLVLNLIPKVVQIVSEEACAHYGFDKQQPQPQPVLSMRTPYKVHVNFPAIFTVEASAHEVRKRIINRCRSDLSGLPPLQLLREEAALQQQVLEARAALRQLPQDVQEALMQQLRGSEGPEGQHILDMLQDAEDAAEVNAAAAAAAGVSPVADSTTAAGAAAPDSSSNSSPSAEAAAAAADSAGDPLQQLDWESVIDSPHGSLRLLGSCKAPWMDSDPAWVTEKSYSKVQYVDGVWMRQPLSYAAVQQCSILLDAMEQRVFEQSQDFLEAVYQAADRREQLLAAKRIIRSCSKVAKLLRCNGSVSIDSLFTQKQPQPQQPSKRKQTQQAQQQKAADQVRQQQQKKQEALTKLQAVQASKQVQPAAAAPPSLSKPALVRPGFVDAPDARQLQQQMVLWQQMQAQQQALAREQEQLLVQQQQLLQALQVEDERQQQLALAAEQQLARDELDAEQQRLAAARQAAEAAAAEQQRQQKKQEALAKLQAVSRLRQQQPGAAAELLLNKPGLVRPGGVPQQQQ